MTKKLYYSDLYLSKCKTNIVSIGDDYIQTDSTVAYPEGGGQESDTGCIRVDDKELHFLSVKKMAKDSSHDLSEAPFSGMEKETIRHYIDPNDKEILFSLEPGIEVEISIDIPRRALLSLSHSASHLLYLAVESVRNDAIKNIIGCHIKTNGARFDFFMEKRFTVDELGEVQNIANTMVNSDSKIIVYARNDESDYRFWECDGKTIPCGGTHISRTGIIGKINVKRRGVGKNKERISCSFPDANPETGKYHE
jgi:Ser-tRNA(Ala) deacylase AlaX